MWPSIGDERRLIPAEVSECASPFEYRIFETEKPVQLAAPRYEELSSIRIYCRSTMDVAHNGLITHQFGLFGVVAPIPAHLGTCLFQTSSLPRGGTSMFLHAQSLLYMPLQSSALLLSMCYRLWLRIR